MMLYKNTKVKAHSPDAGVLQGDTLTPYSFKLVKERRRYPAQTITDMD